ncbi:Uncharacterised protein [Bifidobacterium breve]|nr:Uncharacterised protein [Bifidobacterium breve]
MLVAFGGDAGCLADGEEAVTPVEHLTAHLGEELVLTRPIGTERVRAGVALLPHRQVLELGTDLAGQPAVCIRTLGDQGDDIHTEAVDAAIEPPVHHVVHCTAHGRVLPVEIRLLLRELVQVVLAALRAVLPCGAAEVGAPLVRLGAGRAGLVAGAGGTPPVPVGVRVVLVLRRLEPRVLVGGVVDDEVHHDLESAPVRFGQQLVHVVERAEQRVDVPVVGDVVAVVVLRGPVDRREPQHIHAEVGEIVEAGGDALQVAETIAVRVLERPRVNLVHDGVRPPRIGGGAVGADGVGNYCAVESSHHWLLIDIYIARCSQSKNWRITFPLGNCVGVPENKYQSAYARS